MRKLDQVLGPACDVGADVEQQHRRGAGHRDRECQRGAVDAPVAAHVEQAGGERRSRGAAGDERLCTSVGDGASGLHDRRVGGGAHGEGGIGRLRDRHWSIDDLDTLRNRADLVRRSEQQNADSLGRRPCRTRSNFLRAEIGPAGVNRDDNHCRAGQAPWPPLSAAITSRPL